MASLEGAGPLLRPAQMRALTGSVGWSYSPRLRAIPTGSPLGRVLEFPHGPALQDGGAALMSRPSRTTSIIVAGLLVVGCEASHSPRSASQVASHPPAAAEASGSAPSASQVASHPPAAGEASKSSPSASPFPAAGEDTATLDAGRYVTSDPFPIPVSVTVPAGWVSEEPAEYAVFLSTADGVGNDGPAVIALVLSALVFTDPCQDGVDSTPASPNDFVAAVAALRGVTVTAPKDVTVGGLPGKQVTLTAPPNACGGLGDVVMTLPLGHEFGLNPGDTMSLTAIDDNGDLLVIEEKTTPAATALDRSQLSAVLESMSIGGSN
jgi:hypothetical protein